MLFFQIYSFRRIVFRGMHRRAATAVHSAGFSYSDTLRHITSCGIIRKQSDSARLVGADKERGFGRMGGRHVAVNIRRYTLAGDLTFQHDIQAQIRRQKNIQSTSIKNQNLNKLNLDDLGKRYTSCHLKEKNHCTNN